MKQNKQDDFTIIADCIAKDIFNQPSRIRKAYESIKNTIKRASHRIARRG